MNSEDLIHQELIPYFSEIANRLWSGHAAVMVGAGFSRNAKRNSSTSKKFPDWDQLGDIFYEKVNCKISENKDCKESKYRNVLRLADEVQAAFGRGVLDNIIKAEIPDKEYQPSLLHEKLLQLPWVDIFTTNYDTLLERTTERVLQQRYDTVVNKEDLIYSSKPRIIKLHGSFPSERPFIITEEDYRKYPKEYAPFVNTVQQALLENTLCLIGFSGTDPNFLQWIGWIRDNLGKENSPKIYLIGILNISSAQKNLLAQRNIIPLDLSLCKDVNNSHEAALALFLDFLSNEGKIDNKLDWPKGNQHFHYIPDKNNTLEIPKILENWTSIRKKFPKWIIVPDDNREILKTLTEECYSFMSIIPQSENPTDILFLYEYNWRIEKCLISIDSELISLYELIISKYNPFPDILTIDNAITPIDNSNFEWDQISEKWVVIQLGMMRFYRENALLKKWQDINSRLEHLLVVIEPEMKSRFYYERCLQSLFCLDICKMRMDLEKWPVNDSLPYWEARRAGLLAELGEIVEAEKISENSLKTIRNRLNLSPIINDYSSVSQEAYLMQLYRNIRFCSSSLRFENFHKEDFFENFTDRWNTLIRYKCDPKQELHLFDIKLDKEPNDLPEIEENTGFDIDNKNTTYHFGRDPRNDYEARAYLRFIEEVGLPLHLPRISTPNATKNAIKHIAIHTPFLAFTIFIRTGDRELANSVFDRKSIFATDIETIDSKIDEYLAVLEKSKDEIKKGDIYRNETLAINLSKILPEVLSRLCVKSSFETKRKLLLFLKELFESEHKGKYRGVKNLTKRLINSFSQKEQLELIPDLLTFPILPSINHLIDDEFIDPVEFLERNHKNQTINLEGKISDDLITVHFETANKEGILRKKALKRLIKLWNFNLLTKSQTEILSEILWNKIDKNGFPLGMDYYYYSYINLPYPNSVNPYDLYKSYINSLEIPIQKFDSGNKISHTDGDIMELKELIGTGNISINYNWDDQELNGITTKIITWWDSDKDYLNQKESSFFFFSTPLEFKRRFENLIGLYSKVFSSNFQRLSDINQNGLVRILNEFEQYGMSDNEMYTSFYNILPQNHPIIYSKITNSLFSKNEVKIIDALRAIIKLGELKSEKIELLLIIISEQIKNRCEIGLVSYLETMNIFVKNHSSFLTQEILNNIEFGLKYLIEETRITLADTAASVNNKISIKIEVAELTVALYYYYYKIGTQNMPNFIDQWRTLCLDKNEFSEIRRIWLDVTQ